MRFDSTDAWVAGRPEAHLSGWRFDHDLVYLKRRSTTPFATSALHVRATSRPVKTLPMVIASPSRNIAIEVTAFDGAHAIENRDAVGYYFDVLLEPRGKRSRLAVMFSGTVMAVRPDAFGLPAVRDRDAAMLTFAEAAIGDSLDADRLPAFTPSGVSAAKIECFSPHFQSWRDRSSASDDEMEDYLVSHVMWAWKYSKQSWHLGMSDMLRLNQPLAEVMRLVTLHEGDVWTLADRSATGVTLTPLPSYLRAQRVAKARPVKAPEPESVAVPPESSPAEYVYVDDTRIADLRRLDSESYDLRKLVALCEELNQCYRAQCYHAVAALTRAVLDHVPPVLGFRTFAEVANNHAGTRTFQDTMRRLDESARKIADGHLHTPMRRSEVLPTRVQVNFSNDVDVLLAEIIRLLQPKTPPAGNK